MLEELIVRHCAPTLARLKTGSLFSCACPDMQALNQQVAACNRTLRHKGVQVIPLCRKNGRALIYVYRPARLQGDLEDPGALALLEGLGYPVGRPGACIARLSRRLSRGKGNFPMKSGCF